MINLYTYINFIFYFINAHQMYIDIIIIFITYTNDINYKIKKRISCHVNLNYIINHKFNCIFTSTTWYFYIVKI